MKRQMKKEKKFSEIDFKAINITVIAVVAGIEIAGMIIKPQITNMQRKKHEAT
jgi:hypothetical protein